MKRLIILFLIMSILGGAAYFINKSQTTTDSSINVADREFAYEDINDIGKVVLKRAGGQEEKFEFRNGKWYVNDYLMADYKVNTIMKGITACRIENLPPKTGIPVIYESIEKSGIHVSVYNRSGKKVRSYTIGPDAINDRCTYFIMDGSKQPYCMNVSGFGSMRSRFTQSINNWRDIALYRVESKDIASVKVEYNKDYTNSFQINNSDGNYSVEDIGGKTQGKVIDDNKVKIYLESFKELYGEGYDNEYGYRDSISTLVPFMTVTLTRTDGNEKSIKLYPVSEMIDPNDEVTDAADALTLSKFYVDISTGDFMVAQQKLLKPIMRPYTYFIKD